VRVGDLGIGTGAVNGFGVLWEIVRTGVRLGVSDLVFASFLSFDDDAVEDVLEMGTAEAEEEGSKSVVVPDELVEGCVFVLSEVVVVVVVSG
jgi:hypothetical protein